MDAPGSLSTLGEDHAMRSELLGNKGVIPLDVELSGGQHHADTRMLGSRFDNRS
jgi:hypothetical protein